MDANSWFRAPRGYCPTLLLDRASADLLGSAVEELTQQGWDIRTLRETDGSENGSAVSLAAAARAILPDLIVASGIDSDPWALETTRELRSDPATHELGLIVAPQIALPDAMEVTPMSGPDAWIYKQHGASKALDVLLTTSRAAQEGHLEWAHRDWTATDQRRQGLKCVELAVEEGSPIRIAALAERLFGPRVRVDARIWEAHSPHPEGWRFGGERRYQRPLLVEHEASAIEDELAGQRYRLISRSGRLLLAAVHEISELSGGWPTLE